MLTSKENAERSPLSTKGYMDIVLKDGKEKLLLIR
jgi:hypothetical protein